MGNNLKSGKAEAGKDKAPILNGKLELQDEVNWKMEIDHEDEYTIEDALNEIVDFWNDGVYDENKKLCNQIKQMMIETKRVRPISQEEIDNTTTSRGKAYWFKFKGVCYVTS